MAVDSTTSTFSITGNPGLDSLIRSGVIAASGVVTGLIVTWLGAHGFTDPNLTLLIGTAVFTTLLAGAAMIWGWIKASQIGHLLTETKIAGITAGINLTASGAATTTTNTSGQTIPAPVTASTADTIIRNFGPSTPPPILKPGTTP